MKSKWIIAMGLVYIAAGINHFIVPEIYLRMMPRPFPYPLEMVYLSGVAEILCGAGLLFRQTRKVAAWATILLLIAVFPANVFMALHPVGWNIPVWVLYARLPLQGVLIWLAYISRKH